VHESVSGTGLTKPDLMLCPQLAGADISPKRVTSRSDSNPVIGRTTLL